MSQGSFKRKDQAVDIIAVKYGGIKVLFWNIILTRYFQFFGRGTHLRAASKSRVWRVAYV